MLVASEYKPTILDPVVMIAVYEGELKRAEKEVEDYKRKISLLRKSGNYIRVRPN